MAASGIGVPEGRDMPARPWVKLGCTPFKMDIPGSNKSWLKVFVFIANSTGNSIARCHVQHASPERAQTGSVAGIDILRPTPAGTD